MRPGRSDRDHTTAEREVTSPACTPLGSVLRPRTSAGLPPAATEVD